MKRLLRRLPVTAIRGDAATMHPRRGAMLVVICLCLSVLLVVVAFCVDIAYMQLTRTELRAATDAAARAAAEALSREQSTSAARDAAKAIALQNEVANQPLRLRNEDIIIGRTDITDHGGNFVAGGTPPNAVKIMGLRTRGSASGSVPLFFGKMFNFPDFQPQQSAVAANLDRDIALVVDHSGSMLDDNKWSGLQNAVDVFFDEIDSTPQREYVSLIGYSTKAYKFQPLGLDLGILRRIISFLFPWGNTNIGDGLKLGSDSLENDSLARPFAAKTIILMTDGMHNTGMDPLAAAEIAKSRKHTVHTITFGSECDEELMREVAQATGGRYYHADTNSELLAVFREIARTLPIVLSE